MVRDAVAEGVATGADMARIEDRLGAIEWVIALRAALTLAMAARRSCPCRRTVPMPSARARCGLSIFWRSPSIRMEPASGWATPDRMETRVDLPAPLSPTSASTSPGWSEISTRSSAVTWPKNLEIPRASRNGLRAGPGALPGTAHAGSAVMAGRRPPAACLPLREARHRRRCGNGRSRSPITVARGPVVASARRLRYPRSSRGGGRPSAAVARRGITAPTRYRSAT